MKPQTIIKTNNSGTSISSIVRTSQIITKPKSLQSDNFGGLYRY